MHLQIRSVVTAAGAGGGARNTNEGAEGITIARPGRLLRLLDILAEDRTGDARSDGRTGFSLVRAAGSAIETTGVFIFSVATDEEHDYEDHQAALDRIRPEFPRSEIVERLEADLPHERGALRNYIRRFAEEGLLVDEIVLGVAGCADDAASDGKVTVPIQVSAIQVLT